MIRDVKLTPHERSNDVQSQLVLPGEQLPRLLGHHDELELHDEFRLQLGLHGVQLQKLELRDVQLQLELRDEQLPQLLVHHDELELRDEFQLQLELRGD